MNKLEKIILALLLLVGFVPAFGSVDKIGFQWLYLSTVNLLYLVYKIVNKENTQSVVLSKSSLSLIIFVGISGLSLLSTTNLSESLIEFSRLIILLITLGSLGSLIKTLDINLEKTLRFTSLLLLVECIVFFGILAYQYNYEQTVYLKGIAANINIQAFSIVIKIPLVLFGLVNKNKNYGFVQMIALWLAVSIIFLISSRAALLSLSIIISVYVLIASKDYIKNIQNAIKYTLPGVLLTLLVINPIIKTGGKLANLALVNASTLTRLDFYKEAWGSIIENPLLGVGIGNWKIFSIQAHKELVNGYTVPYHAHNDFLQIGSEIGIFGLLAYILIFAFAVIILVKTWRSHSNKSSIVALLVTLLVYLIDANLNFPISRPIIQVQLLFVLALTYVLFRENSQSILRLKIGKGVLSLGVVLLLATSYSAYKVYDSFKLQRYLLGDFETQKYDTPLEIIESLDDNYPNITATTLPIKAIKANYYKDNATVNRLLDLGSRDNPFIKYPQALKSIRLRASGDLDSSLIYAKNAYEGLPFNELHIINYLSILTELKDSVTAKKVFKKVKGMNSKNIWNAYLLTHLTMKTVNSQENIKVFKEAVDTYPDDEKFKLYLLRMTNGDSIITEANNLFKKAETQFNEKEYIKSAKNYMSASKLLPEDPAYLENAGHGYYMSNQNRLAMQLFDSVINHYNSKTAKAHYLKGLMVLETKNATEEACELFNIAIRKGNQDAQRAKQLICRN